MAHAPKHRSNQTLPVLTQVAEHQLVDLDEQSDMALRQALFDAWQDTEIDPMEAMDSMIDELLH